jgi:hypothetical protein
MQSEAIAARIMRFAYIKSKESVSDVLTKPLRYEKISLFNEELVIPVARER